MADSHSPIICVTCQRPLPEDLKEDDAPRYFAQTDLLPTRDGDHNFVAEADNILRYIKVLSTIVWTGSDAADIESREYDTILELVAELSEEAGRRLRLADAAMREIWKRDHGHEEHEKARKEGRN
jgi:hypothetical protein